MTSYEQSDFTSPKQSKAKQSKAKQSKATLL